MTGKPQYDQSTPPPGYRRGPYQFCPYCAVPLEQRLDHDAARPTCPTCGFIHYRNPAPAAGALIMREGQLLFVRRKFEPKAGLWSVPSGFMEYSETPAECVIRELEEETGLRGEIKELIGVYPAGDDPRSRVVLIMYRIEIIGGDECPGDDASELGYFAPDDLPEFAWESHLTALKDFLVVRRMPDGRPATDK